MGGVASYSYICTGKIWGGWHLTRTYVRVRPVGGGHLTRTHVRVRTRGCEILPVRVHVWTMWADVVGLVVLISFVLYGSRLVVINV